MLFIHLGENVVVQARDVVAIFDYEIAKGSEETKEFLDYHQRKDKLEIINSELIKSIVLTTEEVYLSPLSSVTLKRRARINQNFEKLLNR
ncbi:extracellular matrix regulator RemB [Pseudalkalibacillus salsuginis]|uniref:extracellular matrix regulator RemB n=1 Tax=Pseudalkalibacillus salsuginis TaxID=2910972 RepID=UPI002AFF2958|nr:extracellular matrix/biofilm biosynthesis regulator RemA family protein [Pseudalkalibacillus salsuginis]